MKIWAPPNITAMASYSDKTSWWADWRCDTQKMERVTFPGWSTGLLVADAAVPAWEIFAALMRTHGYDFREAAGGTYNCRRISGSESWSLHAYGLAIDLNPSANPYGTHTHDYPQGFIDDVLATGLFKWGIEFDDPMHWEIDVPPSSIGGDNMAFSRGLSEAQWRNLYQLGIAHGSSEQAVVDYWTDSRRSDEQHEKVSAELFETLAESVATNSGGLSRSQVRAIVNGSQIVAPD